MRTAIRNSIILMAMAALAGCGSSASTAGAGKGAVAGKSVGAVVTATTLADGAALYSVNCAGCHGALTSSAKIGADSTRIQSAITGNTGGMSYLATLTATDVQSIATALAPVPIGATLYANNCLACHGGLSTTLKAGADSVRIQTAITGNTGGMSFLATLAPLQVQAIASALAAAPTGTLLYASNCAGCHGVITTSTKIGADFSRIQNAIINNTGGMSSLATLAETDIQAISAVLTAP